MAQNEKARNCSKLIEIVRYDSFGNYRRTKAWDQELGRTSRLRAALKRIEHSARRGAQGEAEKARIASLVELCFA